MLWETGLKNKLALAGGATEACAGEKAAQWVRGVEVGVLRERKVVVGCDRHRIGLMRRMTEESCRGVGRIGGCRVGGGAVGVLGRLVEVWDG